MRTPPRWYFNFRSPYSWLAFTDLTHRYPDVAAAVEWIPYWDPDPGLEEALRSAGGGFLYTPMSRVKHFYILQDIRRLAAQRGLRPAWPVDVAPHWEVCHLAYPVAVAHGKGVEYAAAVYQARFQHGVDVCDPAVVAGIGDQLGIPATELTAAATDPAAREAGLAALLRAYRDDVFGPPFFVHGREKYWGLDRLPAFVARVRGTAAAPAAAPDSAFQAVGAAADLPSGDLGHAGGCG